MIEPSIADNINFILVNPLYSGNIGQAARAMANNGFSRMGLLNPPDFTDEDAVKMALHAVNILHNATVYKNLDEALGDKHLIIGTTNRLRRFRKTFHTPRAIVPIILERAQNHKVAILFGNEASGLSNDEIYLCHEIIHIPAHSDFTSYNLAQSLLIVAYELFNAESKFKEGPKLKLVPQTELESMYNQIQGVLNDIGYLYEDNPNTIINALRRLFGRSGLEEKEVRIFRGIFSQVKWVASEREKMNKTLDKLLKKKS